MTPKTQTSWARRNAVTLTLVAAVVLGAGIFHSRLTAWFSGPATGAPARTANKSAEKKAEPKDKPSPPAPSVSHSFNDPARSAIVAALGAYETVRDALAQDSMTGIQQAAVVIAEALRSARAADTSAPREVHALLDNASAAASVLAAASDLDNARAAFATVSSHIVPLVTADSVLQENRHVFECTMQDGYNRWLQPGEGLANPYKGQDMLTCGSEKPWQPPAEAGTATNHTHDPSEIAYYTCPMHPWVKQENPDDKCPVCSMDLTPVTVEELEAGVIRIDRERRQLIGVTTAVAKRQVMTVPVRAVGRVAYDETRLADVTLRYKGWIEKLFVEENGQHVKRGQPLFTVYSPELFAGQHELILAASQAANASTEMEKSRSAAMLRGARKRMQLWGVSAAQVDRIIAGGKPLEQITVTAPSSGHVIEKNIVEGAAVEAGQRLYRIANLDNVWVEADVYEQDMPLIRKGQSASVTMSHVPGKTYAGTVSFIYPYLDDKTRTTRVRVALSNKELNLKPDMFAEVQLDVALGPRLTIPEAAIIYSGPRRIVFVDLGETRLRPVVVETGASANGLVEITSGLSAGDTVVVSGNFLVAAESRLKSATGIW